MTGTDPRALARRVVRVGEQAGLDRVGTCDAAPFVETRKVLEERAAAGLSAGMQFTYRNPRRSTEPERALEGVRSLVVGALGYAHAPAPRPVGAHGRVARYATSDHYERLRAALETVADELRSDGHRAKVLADDNALVDRAAAVRAGLGWFGKSANVLLPGHGSWFVLGSVLTDAELGERPDPVADGCAGCTRCLDRCPTGAIIAPGVVDARRCLAWHVQREGDLPHEYRVALGDRIYGCDECQEVCPPSRREEAAAGGREDDVSGTGGIGSWADLWWMLRADDAELLGRVGRWYIPRRDPRYLRRNALVALANSVVEHRTADPQDPRIDELLGRYLDSGDELLVGHAAWAALRVGRDDLLDVAPRDASAVIAQERRRWLAQAAHRETGPS